MVTKRRAFYIGLFAVCVATRLTTTIYYIEDTDSLRFALSVVDAFDVAKLQPHFPGYPVFWAAARGLFRITGSFAIGFSLIGGLATFAVVYFAVQLSERDPLSLEGLAIAFVLFFNPLIWLMGNRYMPDLLGVAVALASFSLLTSSRYAAGGVFSGLLAGTRMSYTPLLLPAYLYGLRRRPVHLLAGTTVGATVWLVPMIIDTGFRGLIGAATRQTQGHFTEFGGTVETNPDLPARLTRLVESVWADGFGAWWPGRHGLTLIVAAALFTAIAAALIPAVRAARLRYSARVSPHTPPVPRVTSPISATRLTLLIAAALSYTLWIFLFQNVIYKSRHVLPLIALLAIPLGLVLARMVRSRFAGARAAAAVAALAYAAVTIIVVAQHREPTAIAQVKHYAEEVRPDVVASIPLVNYYLSAQGVEATYLSVQNQEDRERMAGVPGKLLVIGSYPDMMPPNYARADTFYHNPYVNRMWPEVEVYVYDR